MKKKISLLGLILILVLSFTGCGKSETTEYDQTRFEQYAEFVVQNFEAMTTEQLVQDLNSMLSLLFRISKR